MISVDGPVGWIYEPAPPHQCIFPKPDGHRESAIWRCGECGKSYQLVRFQRGNQADLRFEPTSITVEQIAIGVPPPIDG